MRQLDNIKKKYDEIPIPAELSQCVQNAIARSEKERQQAQKTVRMHKRRWMGAGLGAAAAVMLSFTAMVNTNTAFAESMGKVPVIKEIARVLTFRYFAEEGTDAGLVEVPPVEMVEKDANGLGELVNEKIQDICQKYVDEAMKKADGYREAFLATGGTEEEWASRRIETKVGYEVLAQSEDYLSFKITGGENWNSAGNSAAYFTIDLKTEKPMTLKDILGEDYMEIANESIKSQMKTRKLEHDMPFWTPEQGGFTTITEDTAFYVNQAGNPVILFGKYEIAPGAAGEIEFEIPANN